MISLRKFGGEVPLLPPSELPPYAAQQAVNCDFSSGELVSMNGGYLINTVVNSVKSIYTEDGINFFTWPHEAWPVKSTVMRDTYDRVYYLDNAGVLRVTTKSGATPTGGEPSLSYKAGVPRPTVAPVLAIVDRTDLRDYPGATFTITAWWEYNGKRYQEASVVVTEVAALRSYSFYVAVRDTVNTPDGAVVRATFKALDSGLKPFMTITMTAGDTDTRSNALPGGVTFALTKIAGEQHRFDLTYGISETRAYIYTTANTWNEESPPSPPTQVSTTYIQDVMVTLTAVSFAGGYRPLSAYRTYRTVGTSADYLLVKESASLVFTDDSSRAEDILGSLETADYASPPASMDAIVALPSGAMAGFKGSTLYLSENYRPHSWQYEIPFQKSIRGICVGAGGLVVTTADGSYMVIGTDPASMQPVPLPLPQAGIAQRSMAKLPGSVSFASNDGIVAVSGTQASMAQSQALFSRKKWQERYGAILADASMRFAHHDGGLVATSSSQALGFILRTDGADQGQLSQFNVQMDSMFQLPSTDALYYSVGSNVYQFAGGAALSKTWWSKDFVSPSEVSLGFGYARVTGSITLYVYADGVEVGQFALTTGHFRVRGGRRAFRWSVKFVGTGTVHEFHLARAGSELKRV